MKQKIATLVMTVIFSVIITTLKAETVSVSLSREGTLAEKVLEQATSLSSVTELTVYGKINEADWNCITKQMSGLESLNMKECMTSFSTLPSFNNKIKIFIMPEGIKDFSFTIDEDNNSLESIELSNSVENINSVFSGCRNLHTIKFGKGLKSITGRGFAWCHNLTNIYINDIVAWCSVNFNDYECCPFFEWNTGSSDRKLYINNEPVTNLIIPEVERINAYAFYNCRAINSVEISEGVKSIGASAFAACTKIINLSFQS